MADTVNVFGKPVKKMTVGVGVAGALIVGIGVYRIRKQQAASAAAQAAADAATAPGTGAGSSDQTDPATGFPYGSAEDAAALTAQSGYNSPIGSGILGGGYSPPVTAQGFTSNPQWAQAAEAYLAENTQGNPAVIGNALGKYIVGSPVADSDHDIINQAIAFEGYPPVPGPDGFPPSIRTAPAPPPPPGGGTGSTTPPPGNPGAVSGFSVTGHKGSANFGWGANAKADNYNLVVTGPQTVNRQTGNVTHTTATLHAGRYTAKIRANNHGTFGPFTTSHSFTVT